MRTFLTKPEIATEAGKQLLDLCVDIVADGKIDLDEIKRLRRWLRSNKDNNSVNAVSYLDDIMTRITADGVVDRDELLELHLAVERVIPTAIRKQGADQRKKRQAKKRDRDRERKRIQKEAEKEERKRQREEDFRRFMRVRHDFAKIAGVSFPNDDGSERQTIIRNCTAGEQLLLEHDRNNSYSIYATKILRTNGQQLGHAPEYLAQRIVDRLEDGFHVTSLITQLTGGTHDRPTRGVNVLVLYYQSDVASAELNEYANRVLAARA